MYTRPLRFTTLQASHMTLTDDRTFIHLAETAAGKDGVDAWIWGCARGSDGDRQYNVDGRSRPKESKDRNMMNGYGYLLEPQCLYFLPQRDSSILN